MKYIDADLLRKEVKRLEKSAHKSALGCADSETRKFHEGKDFAYQHVGILIDSLQQEQQEVDLEEGITNFIQAHYHIRYDNTLENGNDPLTVSDFEDIARHFYELGKNRKKQNPNYTDLDAFNDFFR